MVIDAVVAPVLQTYEQLLAVTVKVAVAPEHTLALVTLTVGNAFTVTALVAVAVQPLVPVTVTVKVPAALAVIAAVVAPVFQA